MARGTVDGRTDQLVADEESMALLKSVLDGEPVGVATAHETAEGDFFFDYVNPAYQAQKPSAAMQGHTYSEIWPEVANEVLPRFARVAETGETWIESDVGFEIEMRPGVLEMHYFTFSVSRLRPRPTALLVITSVETTATVEARNRLQRELETTHALLHAADTLSRSVDLREVLASLVKVVAQATGYERVTVLFYDPVNDVAEVVSGGLGESAPEGTRIAVDSLSPQTRRSIVEKRPQVVDYDAPDMPSLVRQRGETLGYRLLLLVPIVRGDQVLGWFSVDDPRQRHEFTERVVEITSGIAAQAAVAIENARLFEAERRAGNERTQQAAYAEALNRINDIAHSSLDFDEILQRTVVEATKATGLDMAAVHLREPEGWRFAYSYGLPASMQELRLADEDAPLSSRVTRERTRLVVDDASTDPRVNRSLMSRFGIHTLVGLPLVVRGDVVGVMIAGCYGTSTHLHDRQVDFITKVAATVSSALQNARAFESERRVADKLQEALLEMPERLPGVVFANAYHGASEAVRVGGDFYDVFEIPDDQIGAIIGDVAGKGLNAAVLTSLAKNTIRAHAMEKGNMPGRILQLTNDVLYKATAPETFVTAFFGVLDCSDGSLVYANAGHTTGAVIGAEGVRRLPATSPILGALDAVDVEQQQVSLGEDDVLFLYTDGLTEARRNSELFGEERVLEVLNGLTGRQPSDVVRQIMGNVLTFTERHLADDLALLAVKRATG